jgi:ribosomal protein S18 acetylase RimI-like enzyme
MDHSDPLMASQPERLNTDQRQRGNANNRQHSMARVDFGDFGTTEPVAVLDSIAVDPDYRHTRIGGALLSQLLANLTGLRLEKIRTEVGVDHFDVLHFLMQNGFRNSQRLAFSYFLAPHTPCRALYLASSSS